MQRLLTTKLKLDKSFDICPEEGLMCHSIIHIFMNEFPNGGPNNRELSPWNHHSTVQGCSRSGVESAGKEELCVVLLHRDSLMVIVL